MSVGHSYLVEALLEFFRSPKENSPFMAVGCYAIYPAELLLKTKCRRLTYITTKYPKSTQKFCFTE